MPNCSIDNCRLHKDNSSFILKYSGEEEGQLYINSIIRDDARLISLSRIKNDYLLDGSNYESKTFLFEFAFALFGNKKYIEDVVLNFNNVTSSVPKNDVKKIMWYYRLNDLVIRISANYPGFGDYRVTSVWIYDIKAYEMHISGNAKVNIKKFNMNENLIVHKNNSIKELIEKSHNNNMYIIEAYVSKTRDLNDSEINKLKEIDNEKYMWNSNYEIATLKDENEKIDVVIPNLPLTQKEESLIREYQLIYHEKQNIYIAEYSTKLGQ